MKKTSLYQKIMALETVPFYGLIIGLWFIGVILGNIILGSDYAWISNGLVGGVTGLVVANRLFPDKTDDREENDL